MIVTKTWSVLKTGCFTVDGSQRSRQRAHAVARRTREIGVRLALGAQPGKMISMVLREAVVVTALGLAIGLPFTLVLGDALRALLHHVQRDALILASGGIALRTIALLAAYFPALRASRVRPDCGSNALKRLS